MGRTNATQREIIRVLDRVGACDLISLEKHAYGIRTPRQRRQLHEQLGALIVAGRAEQVQQQRETGIYRIYRLTQFGIEHARAAEII